MLDPGLNRLAESHSQRMAAGQVPLGHAGFDQRAQTIKRSLSYRRLAENVGYNRGYTEPAAVAVRNWLRSSQHVENIKGDFELTGIGVVTNERVEYYFTQIFLKPSK